MAENPSTPPAGGAAIGEVIGATTGALILTAALLYIGWAHRTGRIDWLRRAADRMGEVAGAPSWAVLPGNIASISLLVAVFGMYWDISLHIGEGRDPGPLANPAHYFILAGLFGIFAAGFLASPAGAQSASPATGTRRSAGSCSSPAGPSHSWASRSTTCGTASSART